MDLLNRMLEHDRWTTTRFLRISQPLNDEQLDQEFDIGLRTLRATFDHIILNTEFWTGYMIGQPIPYEETNASIDELLVRHERSYAAFADVARRLHDEGRLEDRFDDHYQVSQEMGATVLHVIEHNAGHRTEALHILRRLDVEDLPDGDPQEWEHLSKRD